MSNHGLITCVISHGEIQRDLEVCGWSYLASCLQPRKPSSKPSNVVGLVTNFTELRINNLNLLPLPTHFKFRNSSHPSPSKADFPIDSAKALVIVVYLSDSENWQLVIYEWKTLQAYVDIAVHTAYTLIHNRLEDFHYDFHFFFIISLVFFFLFWCWFHWDEGNRCFFSRPYQCFTKWRVEKCSCSSCWWRCCCRIDVQVVEEIERECHRKRVGEDDNEPANHEHWIGSMISEEERDTLRTLWRRRGVRWEQYSVVLAGQAQFFFAVSSVRPAVK